jgi:hypothetical protein
MADTTNTYWLDEHRRIVAVAGSWEAFAHENGGLGLGPAELVGRPIWGFITDATTRMWFEVLLNTAELRASPIERPYRCDSPELRRYMVMRVVPESRSRLRVEHELVRTEPRRVPTHIEHVQSGHGGLVHVRCSMCGRVRERGTWREPDEQTEGPARLQVVYTVCPDCLRMLPNTNG